MNGEGLPLGGAHHRALFEANPHATFALSPDGLFVDLNDITAELSGYGRERLLGRSFTVLLAEGEEDVATGAFLGALAGEPQKAQVSITTSDGVLKELSVAVVPVVVDDEVVGVAGIAEDMTVEHTLQRDLETAREAAEQAAAAKSLFLANMSHEVRTPLTSVLAVTELLGDGELDEEQQHLLEVARRSGHRLMLLVEDILDVSRMDAGEMRLERADLRLADVLADVRQRATSLAEAEDLRFVLDVLPGAPEVLHGDAERLAQVLDNLVANAVKFTDDGEVTLAVDRVVRETGDGVRFAVSDTGLGIPPQHLSSLFEPFTQVDPSQTRRHGGAGLGLSICRDLTRLMGGTLTAVSTLGSGSVFTVVLPLRCPEQSPEA